LKKDIYLVNILTEHEKNVFFHQLPLNRYPQFKFYENGDTSIAYDFVVIYENVKYPIVINCDPRNILFISGEPPLSRTYTRGFIDQFNYIISSHSGIKHPRHFQLQQSLPWHFGFDFTTWSYKYDYEYISQLKLNEKQRKISVIASGKQMMPGHRKRLEFIERLRNEFNNEIDFYGKGINPINDKADAILPYYMTICIENSDINNYWTEKIADAFLGFSLPVYSGCKNIIDYFPQKSLVEINLDKQGEAIDLIRLLLEHCETTYNERTKYILEARKLVLEKYNIFSVLVDFFYEEKLYTNMEIRLNQVRPNQSFHEYFFAKTILKAKRYFTNI
jgi:hypothetical protein